MTAKRALSTDLVLVDFLPYRLHIVAERVSIAFSRIYKDEFGLNRPEWRVLAVLAQLPKSTATEIGVLSSMHKTKISRAVAALEQRKWLRRWSDDKDRRVEWLELTRTGRARFAALSRLASRFEATLHDALGASALAGLEQALGILETASMPSPKRAGRDGG